VISTKSINSINLERLIFDSQNCKIFEDSQSKNIHLNGL
jgi:hypothetical protein